MEKGLRRAANMGRTGVLADACKGYDEKKEEVERNECKGERDRRRPIIVN